MEAQATSFMRGGQVGWAHPAFGNGYYHTYDALDLGPAGPAHRLHVLLPPNYDADTERFPLVIMNDGHAVFFPGGIGGQCWNVPAVLGRLLAAQSIQPMLVAAVCPFNRNREYTHAQWTGPEWGGLWDYADYLADGIKPFMDANYRTLSRQTMLAGSSHGGLAAFAAACHRPDVFSFAAAMSPSFWVGLDDATRFPLVLASGIPLRNSQLLEELRSTLADREQRPTIYLDWGLVRSGGPHNQFIEERATARGREMAALLQQEFGYILEQDLFVREDSAGEHNETSWGRRFSEVLRLFDGQACEGCTCT